MKLKIGENSLRFKITEDELQILRAGKVLHEAVNIAGSRLAFTIDPSGSGDVMISDYRDNFIRLIVPPSLIEELVEKGRSKEGLEGNQDGLSLMLQVDIRSHKHQAA